MRLHGNEKEVYIINLKQIQTGDKYGRLTVLERAENDKDNNVVWKCKCECGNYTYATTSALRKGNKKSCGCLHYEVMYKRLKKYNKYDLSNSYGIGWTTNTNREFYFDLEDYNKIKDYCWCESDQGYAIANRMDSHDKKHIRMHRLVTDDKYGIVDHINNNRMDNRKENLREATKQTNNINRSANKNNKLGIKGIFWNKRSNKFMAKIQKEHKIYSKQSSDLDALIEWRKGMENKLYGEYAYNGN